MNSSTKLEQIKENIRTLNPIFTDELLDLLYEYYNVRKVNEISTCLKDKKIQKTINDVTINKLIAK